MKRFIAALLILGILSISLSGCKAHKKQVAICVPQNTAVDTTYLKSSLEAKGYQVTVFTEKADQQGQILQIHKLYEGKYALVIVEPLISSAAGDILNSPKRRNTTVMFVNYYGTIPQTGENVCYLTGNPKTLGNVQGTAFATLPEHGDLNGDGTVCYAVLAGAEENEEISRQCDGIEETLFGASRLETRRCSNPSEAANGACNGLLATYGRDLEVMVCTDASLAAAAVEAITAAGRQPGNDLYVIGAGESPEAMTLLENGLLSATVLPQRGDDGNQIVQVADAILKGEECQLTYSLTYAPMTP